MNDELISSLFCVNKLANLDSKMKSRQNLLKHSPDAVEKVRLSISQKSGLVMVLIFNTFLNKSWFLEFQLINELISSGADWVITL